MTPLPRRIKDRQDPSLFGDTDLLTLPEAAALMFPDGLLTASALRTAWRAGDLEGVMIARKLFTTKKAVREMMQVSRRTSAT